MFDASARQPIHTETPGLAELAGRHGVMTQPPSGLWRTLADPGRAGKLPEGVDAFYDGATGRAVVAWPRRRILLRRAARIVALQSRYESMSSDQLRDELSQMRAVFRRSREKKPHVDHALAMVREVAWRELGMRPYLVQVAAALAMVNGCVAEMATGEGKTLSATMPATLFGWRGHGCHVLTSNDYLAARDAEETKKIYNFCGLTVASVTGENNDPAQRKAGYLADITYTTNKEVAADFLRDRLALGRTRHVAQALLQKLTSGRGSGADRLVMRGVEYAIIDEADSILIDEAVTPLIISGGGGANKQQTEVFVQAAQVAKELELGVDYRIDFRFKEIELTEDGHDRVRELTAEYGGLWSGRRRSEELVVQALTVLHLYQKDQQYIIDEGKIVIVDEATGRLMPDRTWRDGMHQAAEAKEGLEVNPPKETLARVSFQRFFRLYKKLAGMTGTGWEARYELWPIYRLPVVRIPTNRPCIRKQAADRVFVTKKRKWAAIVDEIEKIHQTGRPILVGTRSVEDSERLAGWLTERGMESQVLNAVRHEEEAQIVARAGEPGRITVATNMAGRGTDIKLGGNVKELGGLHVIACERYESGRVDRQLFGRSGRQGDPGSAIAYVSLEDELIKRYGSKLFKKALAAAGDREITGRLARRLIAGAQAKAQNMALRQRKQVLKTDDWLDQFLGFAGREN